MRVSGRIGPERTGWLCVSVIILFMYVSLPVPGEEIDKDFDPVSFLGLNPVELGVRFGMPQEVFTFRGDESREDNVVFYYPGHIYFFFFENRVWQVRMDRRFEGSVVNLTMGMAEDETERNFGKPLYKDERSSLFRISHQGYPVKVRLFFKDGKLNDCYVYRGDY